MRSQPGEGVEFVIRLRHTQQGALALPFITELVSLYPDTLEKVEWLTDAGGEKSVLLLVEDHEDIARYIVCCIQADSYILRAENGQMGIDLAFEKIPDLILSDVTMPLKDGFDLCNTLKNNERTSHVPIATGMLQGVN